jgi:dTDP-4-amino-4,6-dideoxygalactose transaminase
VLSDAAHSLGAIYKGNKTGTRADITAFSFHAVKNLTTSEGGAIAFNLPPPFDNTEIYRHFRIKALHGQTKDAFSKLQGTSWRYDILEAGYKYNMPDVLAAIGLVELERYDNDTLPRRRAIFEHYDRLLRRFPLAELPLWQDNTGTTSFHVYMLRFKGITESQRDEIIAHMHAMGIMVNVHFVPLPMMSFYKQQGYDIGDYPVAYDLYSREISLPVYYDLTGANVEEVVAGLEKAVSKTLG